MDNSNIKAVEAYLDAIRTKDLSRAPVDNDITFTDPLTERSTGREAWTKFVSSMLPALTDVRVKRHIAEGEYVATHWEADTIWGVIPIFEYFHISEGRIKEAHAFLDPRPITSAQGS
jgi:predicted ester cyclase